MEERTKKAAIVIVLVLGGLGVSITYIGPLLTYGVSHHLEESVPDQLDVCSIGIGGLQDTNLTITYRNDSSLLYELDFTLYEPATFTQAMTVDHFSDHWLFLNADQRIQSLSLVLGTGLPYTLAIWGETPLNTTIIIDNGAIFNDTGGLGAEITYWATGILRFAITEDIIVGSDVDIELGTLQASKSPEIIHLAIDLPTGVNGVLDLHTVPASFSALDGWYFRGSGRYSTSSDSPCIWIDVGSSDYVYASLRD